MASPRSWARVARAGVAAGGGGRGGGLAAFVVFFAEPSPSRVAARGRGAAAVLVAFAVARGGWRCARGRLPGLRTFVRRLGRVGGPPST